MLLTDFLLINEHPNSSIEIKEVTHGFEIHGMKASHGNHRQRERWIVAEDEVEMDWARGVSSATAYRAWWIKILLQGETHRQLLGGQSPKT